MVQISTLLTTRAYLRSESLSVALPSTPICLSALDDGTRSGFAPDTRLQNGLGRLSRIFVVRKVGHHPPPGKLNAERPEPESWHLNGHP
jgi:hypothetical protein